jgi:hypothetical protein
VTNLPILASDAGTSIVDPRTGEAVLIHDATLDQLAACREWIRDLEHTTREAKGLIDAEVVRRFDATAKWSATVAGFKLSAPSPAPAVEYDAQELRGRLEELVADGVLSMDAVDAAVEVVTGFKARAAGINALRKLGGPVAAVVEECSRVVEKPRRVSVSRVAA